MENETKKSDEAGNLHNPPVSGQLPPTWAEIEKRFIKECCEGYEAMYSLDKEMVYNIKSDSPYEMLEWWKAVVGGNFR